MTTTPTQEFIIKMIIGNGIDGRGVPIAMFDKHEPMFREYMRANDMRAIYRGPRISNKCHDWTTPSMTMRCDAKRVKFYLN